MKKLALFLLSSLIILSCPIFVHAEGAYFSINTGVAIVPDYDWDDPDFGSTQVEIESEAGFCGGIALGYGFSNNYRLEGEIVYQANDLDKITVSDQVSVVMSGDHSSMALLLNGYYDFANDSKFTPFISAGIGYAQININDVNYVGSGVSDIDDDDKVFAYQGSVGVGYALSEQTSFDVKYRFFGTTDPEFGTSSLEYGSHNIYAGIRFAF